MIRAKKHSNRQTMKQAKLTKTPRNTYSNTQTNKQTTNQANKEANK